MKAIGKASDDQLLPLLRTGDDAAFAELYKRYQSSLFNFLHQFLKSPELTEDITQEIFVKLWDNHETLPELNFKRISKNKHKYNFLP